jgi:CheY-like chemotaxis protein
MNALSGSKSEAKTILVVDDDAATLRLMTEVLKLYEYRVHKMESGEAALEWVQANPAEIHLLITDVRMPGMDGRELARRFLLVRPAVPVLFVTAYSDFKASELVGHREPGKHILEKPFGPSALIQKVEVLLNPL